MLDTVRFEIRGITAADMAKCKLKLDSHLVLENESGSVRSELIRGTLTGSWDSRISVQIRDYEYQTHYQTCIKNVGCLRMVDQTNTVARPVRVMTDEYLIVEFSLPKWAEGVNFINSTLGIDHTRLLRFRDWLCFYLDIDLPDLDEWKPRRVDVAFCFQLGNYSNILRYVQAFRNLDFPRRKKPQFYQDSFFCVGSTTTLKGYAKESEFKAHDYKRLYGATRDKMLCSAIHDLTKGLFRFEVEFKHRKLETLGIENANDIFQIDWESEMKKELFKLIKGGKTGKVFKYTEVIETLRRADLTGMKITREGCEAVWSTIVLEGDKYAKQHYGKMKVSRALKVFESLGITTLGLIKETKVSPVLTEINLMQYDRDNGQDLRRKYNSLFKKAV